MRTPDLEAAEGFIWLSARVLDRHRFARRFMGGDRGPVVTALRAYQNPDGGFGNGLEPDLRGPGSQPQPAEVALHLLDEVDAFDDPMVGRLCDHLESITTPAGGVPFVLPSAREHPHAPWWEPADDPPASLNPTAALAGLLAKHGVEHPWRARATAFCWKAIEQQPDQQPYDLLSVLTFLEHVPDRSRAERTFAEVGRRMLEAGHVSLEPGMEGHVFTPIDFAPAPSSMARQLFDDGMIEAHLDALAGAQEADGGWPISWPPLSDLALSEWRGVATLNALSTLQAYGRVPESQAVQPGRAAPPAPADSRSSRSSSAG